MNLITAASLTKRFRNREVIRGIDLEVKAGQILALLGPNGAGKSTTIAMLMGMIRPDTGHVTYWKKDYKNRIGVQLQSTPFFEGYTAEENLKLFAALYRVTLDRHQLASKLEECKLAEAANTPANRLSLGQQKRLAIAVTTVHQPELIVLDEPTAGLDPRARHDIRQMIRSFADRQRAVLFSSHDLGEVEQIADRVVFLFQGRIVADGQPEQLLREHQASDLEGLYLQLTENEGKAAYDQ